MQFAEHPTGTLIVEPNGCLFALGGNVADLTAGDGPVFSVHGNDAIWCASFRQVIDGQVRRDAEPYDLDGGVEGVPLRDLRAGPPLLLGAVCCQSRW